MDSNEAPPLAPWLPRWRPHNHKGGLSHFLSLLSLPRMFRWVRHESAAQGSGSDSSDMEEEDQIEEPAPAVEEASQERSKIKIKLGPSSSGVCHVSPFLPTLHATCATCLSSPLCLQVCGQKGHVSGFVGAVYFDCPAKPCYLCGVMGHSTRTCPYRLAPGHGCTPAANASGDGLLSTLRAREAGGRCRPARQLPPGRWQIQSAVLKLHARRVTCLEFHPTLDNLVLSGDKHGQVAVWDWQKCFERTVYKQVGAGVQGEACGGGGGVPR